MRSVPSQVPSACTSVAVRAGRARPHIGTGPSARRRAPPGPPGSGRARFSSSVASSPAYRALRGPGRPPSASTSIPESSASAGSSERRRRPPAPSARRSPDRCRRSPPRRGTPPGRVAFDAHPLDGPVARRSARARGACGGCGSRARSGRRQRHRHASAARWISVSSAIPAAARSSSVVELFAGERRPLGRPLHLDELARARHHDVAVHLRAARPPRSRGPAAARRRRARRSPPRPSRVSACSSPSPRSARASAM